jgi:predicted ATPase/class 3 adenylate cyclase/Tfp pilus assembly protein PilF
MGDIRALLLTDIVDSTRLAEQMGDAASSALWAAHDRAARDLLPRRHGREIDRTDGLLILFESADDAVGYALDYHAALAHLRVPLKARAGVHVGSVTLRENSASDVALGAKLIEVEGLAKPIAARVMDLALGGQTLLTLDARQALRSAWRIQSHGHWRFKGIAEPIEVFEVGDVDSPGERAFTPPSDAPKAYRVVRKNDLWSPARKIRHSLPAERDSFVGREDVLVELASRFDAGARLVSVLGMGGTGKTRLALHFSWAWLGDFPGGVWFCDLSQARGLDGIVHAVAAALGVPLGRDDPVVQLGNAIAGRGECLVVLDNFEQVSRHADDTLGRWLDRANEARFLVTSREVLGMGGEEALALPPLQPPDAAQLFLRRAQSARADFRLDAQDQAAILPLVNLLDGLPLAIELAAARVRVLSPSKLLARMSERFRLLASSGKRHDRQATLRATFDWSWELLQAPERAALAQLSVFEGGFTLEAAEAVLDLSALDGAPWTPDLLQSLVDKSFVRQRVDGRFNLLGTMQEYAAEHLRTPGRFGGSGPQALAAARARHAAYFAGLGEKRAVADSCVEVDNLVVACHRAASAGHTDHAVGALECAWAGLKLRGPYKTGVALATQAGSVCGLALASKARVERVLGNAHLALGLIAQGRTHLESALEKVRQAGDARIEAHLLNDLGALHINDGHVEAGQALHREALALARRSGDRIAQCAALNGLGTASMDLGRLDEAVSHYEAALQLARAVADRRWEGGVLGNLGQVYATQGRMVQARSHYDAGLALARELGDRQWEGNTLNNLGLLLQVMGDLPAAQQHLEAALGVARELGHARLECVALCNLGIVFNSLGKLEDARRYYEDALSGARRLRDPRNEGQFLNYLGRLHGRLEQFDEARRCLDAGQALLAEVADPLSLGIILCGRAEVEHAAGCADAAVSAVTQARALALQIGAGPESELDVELKRVELLLRRDSPH